MYNAKECDRNTHDRIELYLHLGEWMEMSSVTYSTSLLCHSTMANFRVGLCKTGQLLAYAKKQWWRRTKQQTERWKFKSRHSHYFSIASIQLCILHIRAPRKFGHNTWGGDERRDASSVAQYPGDVLRFRLCVY